MRACMRSCVTLAPFSSLWPAFTLTVHINALYNESVHRQEQHTSGINKETNGIKEIKHLKKVLRVAGYSKWTWQASGRKKIRPHPRNTNCDRAKGHMTLPYIGGVTEPISRLIRITGVAAHAKPHTTIRSILVAPKDSGPSPGQMSWCSIPTDMPRLLSQLHRSKRKEPSNRDSKNIKKTHPRLAIIWGILSTR